MGWLPLLLAISAFFGLFVLVHINSIRRIEQAIGYAVFQFCQTAKSRQTLLRMLPDIPSESPCQDIAEDWRVNKKNIAELATSIRKERYSLYLSNAIFQHISQPSETMHRSLELLNHRQLVNIRMLERKVREYNRLLNQQPTKVVARLFNFRPILLSHSHSS